MKVNNYYVKTYGPTFTIRAETVEIEHMQGRLEREYITFRKNGSEVCSILKPYVEDIKEIKLLQENKTIYTKEKGFIN